MCWVCSVVEKLSETMTVQSERSPRHCHLHTHLSNQVMMMIVTVRWQWRWWWWWLSWWRDRDAEGGECGNDTDHVQDLRGPGSRTAEGEVLREGWKLEQCSRERPIEWRRNKSKPITKICQPTAEPFTQSLTPNTSNGASAPDLCCCRQWDVWACSPISLLDHETCVLVFCLTKHKAAITKFDVLCRSSHDEINPPS